ncbi:tigger transposable element-derived protein 4-like [Euwallacea fornicatus]|uniref:tigger transposable element-derived protein 4-like n=1 Tax=Euwallacea fornicatus TaxID=995702 RepID=UPI00338FC3F5
MEKVKRKSLTLDKKLEIIHKLQNGATNVAICCQYKLTSSTVSTIWKNREKYVNVQHVNSLKFKRLRESKHPNVDKDLLKWFSIKRSENVPITGNILKEKATELKKMRENINSENDKKTSGISRGWLDRFKRRYNISSGKIHGESASISSEITSDWINSVWPKLWQKYNTCDIFNGDEMGLFFKMTPDETMKFKGERCSGGKVSEERLTVFVCANMDGSEKKKLTVIGKSVSPKCFKNTNVNNLPVTYFANDRAWMTAEIFKNILEDWDKELHETNRKILLLIDNCPAHSKSLRLRNIEVVFLPPNITATLQPMDQGVIRSLKVYYRQQLLLKLVCAADDNILLKVTVLDAIMMLVYPAMNLMKTNCRLLNG